MDLPVMMSDPFANASGEDGAIRTILMQEFAEAGLVPTIRVEDLGASL